MTIAAVSVARQENFREHEFVANPVVEMTAERYPVRLRLVPPFISGKTHHRHVVAQVKVGLGDCETQRLRLEAVE